MSRARRRFPSQSRRARPSRCGPTPPILRRRSLEPESNWRLPRRTSPPKSALSSLRRRRSWARSARRYVLRRRSTAAPAAARAVSWTKLAQGLRLPARRPAKCRLPSAPRISRPGAGSPRQPQPQRDRSSPVPLSPRHTRHRRDGDPPLPARGSARVVARHSLPHQPPHELPDREVRIHVRQQFPQLLQSALALGVDHRRGILRGAVVQAPRCQGGRSRGAQLAAGVAPTEATCASQITVGSEAAAFADSAAVWLTGNASSSWHAASVLPAIARSKQLATQVGVVGWGRGGWRGSSE